MSRPNWRSLRLRLLGSLGLAALVMVGSTWVLHGLLLNQLARNFLADRLQQESELVVRRLRIDGPGALSLPPDASPADTSHHFYLLRTQNRIYSTYDALKSLPVQESAEGAQLVRWRGHHLLLWRTRFSLGGEPATLTAGEDFAGIERGLTRLHWWIGAAALALLLMLVLLNLFAVNRALRPFGQLSRQLIELQRGERRRLDIKTVSELKAPIDQLNTLLDEHERRQQRSRESLANLSHAIRTPLTAVMQALRSKRALNETRRTRILERLDDIDEKLESELRHSRIAGQSTGQQHTGMAEVISLLEMFRTLYPDRVFVLDDTAVVDFQMPLERQDGMEMLGIVLDNAGKWARQRVELTLLASPCRLRLEDDGPGVPDAMLERLGQRGVRLDEQYRGHGLGLSILAQLADRYGARVTYDRSRLGGLRVEITLTSS
ncbi:MAG: sensor histidine kinase [Pseudomonadota bacterium]|uniref:sensor histidine kinase n=1 Tax=Salinicola TaxID=404432 RepID=UPI000DA26510|nr:MULTISPECIES: sensor histidine kinase [Salinicola]MEC8918331.1 sensor histidine kinase [Pseudomonadota bacterium]MED5500577.1 sensor histidine kinase [Pseudomonadota bacterium]NRB54991.1 sensor histidine kinase [Salinicola sp.]